MSIQKGRQGLGTIYTNVFILLGHVFKDQTHPARYNSKLTQPSKREGERESNMSGCPGKNSWPELVGKDGEGAKTTIERENSNVDAIVLLDGTPVTRDFRCDRVWVWVDSNGHVVRPPTIG
ncbi:hypothetical protein ES288_A11G147100v1 [Gossypium darwinii]|uniref:Uncharacterized protein n=1 Tax=Gossypium darwinii TaxID=34276 RepID=A0A5D2EJS9_GOSDA|nr:hypothetical protein ES288_A11G147100v1 [Gossypium darwinii]